MYEKTKKFLVVVFLTLLIWIWAYMALEQVKEGALKIAN